MRLFVTVLLLSTGLLFAQQPPKAKDTEKPSPVKLLEKTKDKDKDKTPPNPTNISTGASFVDLEPADEIELLRLEKQAQQLVSQINMLYAQSQKALVDMNEATKQKQAIDQKIQTKATAVATRMKVDPVSFDFDADQNKFTKKKKP